MINKLKSIAYQFFEGPVGSLITRTIGNVLVVLQPKKATELSESGLTIVRKNSMSITERLMRAAILKKLEKKQDYKSLAELHQNYWTNKGTEIFLETENTYDNDFLPNWSFIFDELEKTLSATPDQFKTLVEIGTGNGRVLNYLRSKFPKVDTFIGLDLSSEQIAINKKNYKTHPKLEFVAADAIEWVKKNGHGFTIFVASGGVLEYFPEQPLKEFLSEINKLGKIMFVAIEPNDVDHDFTANPNSQVYGHERSFSHNYEKLFKNAGFEIWHQSRKLPVLGSHILTFIGAKN